jgi:hypothetical protein
MLSATLGAPGLSTGKGNTRYSPLKNGWDWRGGDGPSRSRIIETHLRSVGFAVSVDDPHLLHE